MMTFRVHLRKVNKQKETRLKFNLEKLKDPNIHKKFQAMIGGKFAPLTILKDTEEVEDLDTLTRYFFTAITDTAMEILGKHRPKKKKWITDDILEMCDKRRELKNKKHDAQGRSQYRDINNKIRKAIKQAKENWIEEQCEEIYINLTKNNTKRAYQIVKDLTTTKKGRASTIQNKSGKSLTEDQEILTRWTEYCSDLYNHETQGDCAVLTGPHSTNQDDLPILREEVEAAVTSLKKRKSAGVDNIPAELVQAGGEAMIDALHIICRKIWQTGKWPTQWTQSLIITLPKKGNLQMCQNYRTIADDIDGLAGKEEELENLVKKVETASTAYGMEISPEKTKIMSNNANGLTKTIKVKGYNLETVTNFTYLGAIVTDEGTKREVLTRIACSILY